jgi:uncharacterized surface protein with fasciclin (FAS1) repeats
MILNRVNRAALPLVITCLCYGLASQAADKTQAYSEKAGFEKKPIDIVNTLKDNERTSFHTMLEGLQQAFDLDNTLKGKGPYTVFAASDKAWSKIPSEDVQSLFANKTKLKQVLTYQIVPELLDSKALRSMTSAKTMGGGEITFSTKGGDLYVNNALILTTDMPCSNGIIHITQSVIMPKLVQ